MPYHTDKLTMVTRTDGHLVSLGSQLPGRSQEKGHGANSRKHHTDQALLLAADALAQEGCPMEEHTTTTDAPVRAPTQDSGNLLEIDT